MNLQEQLRSLQQKRADCVERQTQIMSTAAEEGRTLDDDEGGEYDLISKELDRVDVDLKRLEPLLNAEKASAQHVEKPTGPTIIVRRHDPDDAFEGQSLVRRAIAKAHALLTDFEMTPGQVAEMRWGKTHPQLVQWIKAGVAGAESSTAAWAGNLVTPDNRYAGDFIEYLRARTIYDRLPLTEVPAHVTVKGQDGIATGYWVGESRSIPVSKQLFSKVSLTPLKVAGMNSVSNELIRDSQPSAERLIRDGLVEALVQRIDQTFLSETGASSGVSPAGIMNGVVAIETSGTTAEALRADINALYAQFLADKNASGLHFVTTPALAKQIGLMRGALSQREFEGITATGGMLEGDPLHTGDNVPADSNGSGFILLKPSDIWRIADTGVTIELSRDATIEQDDDPAGRSDTPVAASRHLVSMFQTESVAFKAVRAVNFQKRRDNAVQWIDGADYGAITSG
jgi:HK97 family phage major capsid protein